MQTLVEYGCGLDVRLLMVRKDGRVQKQMRTFGTTTRELVCLREWLLSEGCTSAGLSRIEIDAPGLVQWESNALIAAKPDSGGCAVLQQGHERDLNGFHSVQGIAELHDADRALDCGSHLDSTTDEYIATAS